MKLRAKANGNIIERDGEEAEALLAAGIYEKVEEAVTSQPVGAPHNRRRGQYARRDMKAEE
jgi:hypothetical protein